MQPLGAQMPAQPHGSGRGCGATAARASRTGRASGHGPGPRLAPCGSYAAVGNDKIKS